MKKILIAIAIMVVLVLGYIGLWIFYQKNLTNEVSKFFTKINQDSSVDNSSYQFTVSGFPFIKAELSNIKVQTKKYFAQSKKGHLISALEKQPIIIQTKNIFSNNLSFDFNNKTYDFAIKNLDNDKIARLYLNAETLTLDFIKNQFNAKIKKLSIEAQKQDNPIFTIASLNYFDIQVDKTQNNNLYDFSLLTNMFGIQLFNQQNGRLINEIKHAKLQAQIDNLEYDTLNNFDSNNTKEELTKIINSAVKNKTQVTINDLKYTDSHQQILIKLAAMLNQDYFLNTDANAIFKFRNKTLLKDMLEKYFQNQSDIYKINISTQNDILKINDNQIKMPHFKPTN